MADKLQRDVPIDREGATGRQIVVIGKMTFQQGGVGVGGNQRAPGFQVERVDVRPVVTDIDAVEFAAHQDVSLCGGHIDERIADQARFGGSDPRAVLDGSERLHQFCLVNVSGGGKLHAQIVHIERVVTVFSRMLPPGRCAAQSGVDRGA